MKSIFSSFLVLVSSFTSFSSYSANNLQKSNDEIPANSIFDMLDALDFEELSDKEKDALVGKLLKVDLKTLQLIKNDEIDLEGYRNEAGSHSFNF